MATWQTEPTQKQIAEAVRQRLAEHPLENIRLEVLENQMWRQNGWWRVPVRPVTNPLRDYHLFDVLAEAEEDLDASDGLDVLLVPVPAEDRTLN